MLGIIIGIAAVIAVVTIGLGGKAAIKQEFEKTGVNLFILYVKGVGQAKISQSEYFTLQDGESLRRNLPQLKTILPTSIEYANVEANLKKLTAVVVGTTSGFAELRRREIAKGRFFSAEEVARGRRVVVLDNNLSQHLFGAGNPLGQQVMIRNIPCRVIGVIAENKSMFEQFDVSPDYAYAYLPWETWTEIFQAQRVDQLEGATFQETDLDKAIAIAKRILNMRHGTTDRYEAFNAQQLVQMANKITRILTSIIGMVAGISLAVGGIGIMNIMLVSVTERTREIGLRKAVGAQERDILTQFLLEAVVLSFSGGIIGIILGIGGALLTAYLLSWPLMLSFWAIIIAVTFSIVIGITFGLYPAWKAAKLQPEVALRFE